MARDAQKGLQENVNVGNLAAAANAAQNIVGDKKSD